MQEAVGADALALYRWMEQQCLAGTCVPNAAAAITIAAEASQARLQDLCFPWTLNLRGVKHVNTTHPCTPAVAIVCIAQESFRSRSLVLVALTSQLR